MTIQAKNAVAQRQLYAQRTDKGPAQRAPRDGTMNVGLFESVGMHPRRLRFISVRHQDPAKARKRVADLIKKG